MSCWEEGAGQLWPHPEMLLEPAGWGAVLGVLVRYGGCHWPTQSWGNAELQPCSGISSLRMLLPCCTSGSLGEWGCLASSSYMGLGTGTHVPERVMSQQLSPVVPLATGISSPHHTPEL